MSKYKQTITLTIPLPAGISVYETETHFCIRADTGINERFFKKTLSICVKYTAAEISFTYLKLNFALTKTIQTTVANAFEDLINGYTIKLGTFFQHFPFRLDVLDTEVSLINYLGRKTSINVPIPNGISVVKLENAEYLVQGRSRIQVGNFVNILLGLRKRVKHKLDKRKFVDNLYVIQKC